MHVFMVALNLKPKNRIFTEKLEKCGGYRDIHTEKIGKLSKLGGGCPEHTGKTVEL